MAQNMQQCIQECLTCHAVCLSTVPHCLQKGGPHAEVNHIRELLDCAQMCVTSADFMLRGSPLHARTCGACAEACAQCAASCERMADDPVVQQCAQTCRRCEQSCREMAGA